MTTVYDVPAEPLIQNMASKLKVMPECEQPEWALFVKTGIHRERPPVQEDWWHVRLGAVMRKVYVHGPIGIERVSSMFGGKADRGVKPNKARKGSRSITRHAFQQLEGAGLVEKAGSRGRKLTPSGRRMMDAAALEVVKELAVKPKRSEKPKKRSGKSKKAEKPEKVDVPETTDEPEVPADAEAVAEPETVDEPEVAEASAEVEEPDTGDEPEPAEEPAEADEPAEPDGPTEADEPGKGDEK
jgi:small subunit ribosomal protein S19e